MKLQETEVVPYSLSAVPMINDVWVFAPHPDDEVFGCGGCLALHAQQGQRIHVVVLTQGEGQTADANGSRLAESRHAADVLGYSDILVWNLPDRGVRFDELLVRRILDCIESTPECIVYAPSLWEAHPDHRACAMAAVEAVRRVGGGREIRLFEVSAPLRTNCLVDVSAVWSLKQRAMACFASQQAVLPYADFVSSLNRYRALTVLPHGYVEAFERYAPHELQSLLIDSPADLLRRQGVAAVPDDLPLVSVLVRTLGRETLPKAVASVLAQTYPRLEIILINASGDATLSNRWGGDFGNSSVRWVGENRRLARAEAANVGLANAQGEWLIFLDDDDWFYPDHIAKLIAASWQDRHAVAHYSDVECVDRDGKPTGVVFDQTYAPRELMYGNFLPIHSVLFSSRVLQCGVRFDPGFDLYEDWDFWLQVELHGRFNRVPGISAAYKIGAGGGAGVVLDVEMARQATKLIFHKWSVQINEAVFDELIRRSLDRRVQVSMMGKLQRKLSQEAEGSLLALKQADAARKDAHALRLAHDHACADRDVFRSEMHLMRQERDGLKDELRFARTQCDGLRARLAALQTEVQVLSARLADQVAKFQVEQAEKQALIFDLESTHARLYQSELKAEQHQARFNQVLASRSWQITRPLRMITPVWQVARRLGLADTVKRSVDVIKAEGAGAFVERVVQVKQRGVAEADRMVDVSTGRSYTDWVEVFDSFDSEQMMTLANEVVALSNRPLISIVMPVYNTIEADLAEAIESVQNQIYSEWELCICDDASTQPHITALLQRICAVDSRVKVTRHDVNKHISCASNTAIAMCTGQYIAFLDHDDVLAPHALLRVVEWLEKNPQTRVLYSDEDKLNPNGKRFDPYFKPDFNLGLLRSHNYMCHFAVYEKQLLDELGGLRIGFEGAQDYDLALRAIDKLNPSEIAHLPHILYHWRVTVGSTAGGHQEKNYAFQAGQKALQEHLKRRQLAGVIDHAPEAPGMYRVRWTLPDVLPLVSIVIPTRNGVSLLRMCLDTLRQTAYANYEVIVIDNSSDDPSALAFMAERERMGEIRVLRDDNPFNFSDLNNRAVQSECKGEFVLLMNNDIEITHPDWLSEMVGVALDPGVGCVGARLWYPDGRLQHGGVIMVCGVAGHSHKYLPRGQHGYMGRAVLAQDFLAVTAACLLVRRSIFNVVGGLDESLQVAFNDVDFCLRVHTAGFRNVWTPFAELIHHESVSRGYEDTPEKQNRFASEVATLQSRWPELIAHDPCYSPNLTSQSEDFSLAWPPRRKLP